MAVKFSDKRLIELLVKDGRLDAEAGKKLLAQAEQLGGIDDSLVMAAGVDGQSFLSYKARALNVPRADLRQEIHPSLKNLLPAHLAEQHNVVPVRLELAPGGEVLHVAMSDPLDLGLIDQLAFQTGRRIKPQLAGLDEITGKIRGYYFNLEAMEVDVFQTVKEERASGLLDVGDAVEVLDPNQAPGPGPGHVPAPPGKTPVAATPAATPAAALPVAAAPVAARPTPAPDPEAIEIDLELPDPVAAPGPAVSPGHAVSIGRAGPPGRAVATGPAERTLAATATPRSGSPGSPAGLPAGAWDDAAEPAHVSATLAAALAGQPFDPASLPHPTTLLVGLARALAPSAGLLPEQLAAIVTETMRSARPGPGQR